MYILKSYTVTSRVKYSHTCSSLATCNKFTHTCMCMYMHNIHICTCTYMVCTCSLFAHTMYNVHVLNYACAYMHMYMYIILYFLSHCDWLFVSVYPCTAFAWLYIILYCFFLPFCSCFFFYTPVSYASVLYTFFHVHSCTHFHQFWQLLKDCRVHHQGISIWEADQVHTLHAYSTTQ